MSSAPRSPNVVSFYRADAVDDATLVGAASEGIEDARRALYERHAPAIERLLFRLLGPSADLADPLCETFRRAFERLGQLSEPAGVRSWLFAIAARVAREHARSARRRSWLSFLPWSEVPEVPTTTHDASGEAREAAARVFLLLEKLSSEARVAFSLRYLEGFELAEIATTLRISVSTTQRRLRAAEEKFYAAAARDPVLRDYMGDDAPLLFSNLRSTS